MLSFAPVQYAQEAFHSDQPRLSPAFFGVTRPVALIEDTEDSGRRSSDKDRSDKE